MTIAIARLPFGSERRLNLGHAPRCPICSAARGELHEPGCMAEECPQCGEVLILCSCCALSARDEAIVISALYDLFSDFDHAMQTAKAHVDADNILHRAALGYAFRHAPEELKAKFAEGFHRFFPNLKPCGYAEDGTAYYSGEDMAEALGMPLEDMIAMAEHLMEPAERGVGVKLQKVQ